MCFLFNFNEPGNPVLLGPLPFWIVMITGFAVPITCAFLMLIIYLSFRKVLTNPTKQFHINYLICILLLYLVFIVGGVVCDAIYQISTSGGIISATIGTLLQFFLLSACGLLTTEIITLNKKLNRILGNAPKRYMAASIALVYSVAIIISILTIVLAIYLGSNSEGTIPVDGLHGFPGYLGYFIAVAISLVANIVMSMKVRRALMSSNQEMFQNMAERENARDTTIRVMVLSILHAVTWAFMIPVTIVKSVIGKQLLLLTFSGMSILHGILIIFFLCLKKKEVRKAFCCQRSRKKSKKIGLNEDVKVTTVTGSSIQESAHLDLGESVHTYRTSALVVRECEIQIEAEQHQKAETILAQKKDSKVATGVVYQQDDVALKSDVTSSHHHFPNTNLEPLADREPSATRNAYKIYGGAGNTRTIAEYEMSSKVVLTPKEKKKLDRAKNNKGVINVGYRHDETESESNTTSSHLISGLKYSSPVHEQTVSATVNSHGIRNENKTTKATTEIENIIEVERTRNAEIQISQVSGSICVIDVGHHHEGAKPKSEMISTQLRSDSEYVPPLSARHSSAPYHPYIKYEDKICIDAIEEVEPEIEVEQSENQKAETQIAEAMGNKGVSSKKESKKPKTTAYLKPTLKVEKSSKMEAQKTQKGNEGVTVVESQNSDALLESDFMTSHAPFKTHHGPSLAHETHLATNDPYSRPTHDDIKAPRSTAKAAVIDSKDRSSTKVIEINKFTKGVDRSQTLETHFTRTKNLEGASNEGYQQYEPKKEFETISTHAPSEDEYYTPMSASDSFATDSQNDGSIPTVIEKYESTIVAERHQKRKDQLTNMKDDKAAIYQEYMPVQADTKPNMTLTDAPFENDYLPPFSVRNHSTANGGENSFQERRSTRAIGGQQSIAIELKKLAKDNKGVSDEKYQINDPVLKSDRTPTQVPSNTDDLSFLDTRTVSDTEGKGTKANAKSVPNSEAKKSMKSKIVSSRERENKFETDVVHQNDKAEFNSNTVSSQSPASTGRSLSTDKSPSAVDDLDVAQADGSSHKPTIDEKVITTIVVEQSQKLETQISQEKEVRDTTDDGYILFETDTNSDLKVTRAPVESDNHPPLPARNPSSTKNEDNLYEDISVYHAKVEDKIRSNEERKGTTANAKPEPTGKLEKYQHAETQFTQKNHYDDITNVKCDNNEANLKSGRAASQVPSGTTDLTPLDIKTPLETEGKSTKANAKSESTSEVKKSLKSEIQYSHENDNKRETGVVRQKDEAELNPNLASSQSPSYTDDSLKLTEKIPSTVADLHVVYDESKRTKSNAKLVPTSEAKKSLKSKRLISREKDEKREKDLEHQNDETEFTLNTVSSQAPSHTDYSLSLTDISPSAVNDLRVVHDDGSSHKPSSDENLQNKTVVERSQKLETQITRENVVKDTNDDGYLLFESVRNSNVKVTQVLYESNYLQPLPAKNPSSANSEKYLYEDGCTVKPNIDENVPKAIVEDQSKENEIKHTTDDGDGYLIFDADTNTNMTVAQAAYENDYLQPLPTINPSSTNSEDYLYEDACTAKPIIDENVPTEIVVERSQKLETRIIHDKEVIDTTDDGYLIFDADTNSNMAVAQAPYENDYLQPLPARNPSSTNSEDYLYEDGCTAKPMTDENVPTAIVVEPSQKLKIQITQEKEVTHTTDDGYLLFDADVRPTTYNPKIERNVRSHEKRKDTIASAKSEPTKFEKYQDAETQFSQKNEYEYIADVERQSNETHLQAEIISPQVPSNTDDLSPLGTKTPSETEGKGTKANEKSESTSEAKKSLKSGNQSFYEKGNSCETAVEHRSDETELIFSKVPSHAPSHTDHSLSLTGKIPSAVDDLQVAHDDGSSRKPAIHENVPTTNIVERPQNSGIQINQKKVVKDVTDEGYILFEADTNSDMAVADVPFENDYIPPLPARNPTAGKSDDNLYEDITIYHATVEDNNRSDNERKDTIAAALPEPTINLEKYQKVETQLSQRNDHDDITNVQCQNNETDLQSDRTSSQVSSNTDDLSRLFNKRSTKTESENAKAITKLEPTIVLKKSPEPEGYSPQGKNDEGATDVKFQSNEFQYEMMSSQLTSTPYRSPLSTGKISSATNDDPFEIHDESVVYETMVKFEVNLDERRKYYYGETSLDMDSETEKFDAPAIYRSELKFVIHPSKGWKHYCAATSWTYVDSPNGSQYAPVIYKSEVKLPIRFNKAWKHYCEVLSISMDSSSEISETNWSTEAIAEYETRMERHCSVSMSLLSRFAELVSTGNASDQGTVSETYQSLTSTLGEWRSCLEEFMKGNHAIEVGHPTQLFIKSKIQLDQVNENENSVNVWYRSFEQAGVIGTTLRQSCSEAENPTYQLTRYLSSSHDSNDDGWSTKAIVKHEAHVKVYLTISLTLLTRFFELTDKTADSEPKAIDEVYRSLTSTLGLWRRCLEEFIEEHHASEVKLIVEHTEKSRVQLAEVMDKEIWVNMRYRRYQRNSDSSMTLSPTTTITENTPFQLERSQSSIRSPKTSVNYDDDPGESCMVELTIDSPTKKHEANWIAMVIADQDARINAHSSHTLSLLNKFNQLIDGADASDKTTVAEIYKILVSALVAWRDCLVEFINVRRDTKENEIAEYLEKMKLQLRRLDDREKSIHYRYGMYRRASISDTS